jgi:hypothetical protein
MLKLSNLSIIPCLPAGREEELKILILTKIAKQNLQF